MSLTSEQIDGQALELSPGRLTARPGPDLYLYTFTVPDGSLPEIGRRGYFAAGADEHPAYVADRRGPELTLCLSADKPLGQTLSGRFQPAPLPARPEPVRPPGQAAPDGTDLFLDPQEGWVMNAAEAAGHKQTAFEPEYWPRVGRADLPDRLATSGIFFIWSQSSAGRAETTRLLARRLTENNPPLLVVGQAPADLESLTALPDLVYTGAALPDSPLAPASLHSLAALALQAREREQAELRNRLTALQRQEAGVKARQANWTDLEALELRFAELGRRVQGLSKNWDQVRQTVQTSRETWEEASLAAQKSARGLLGWLKPGRSEVLAREARSREALTEAEKTMAVTRKEEESALAEARHLDQRLNLMRLDSQDWTSPGELAAELERLRAQADDLAAALAASSARPRPRLEDFLESAAVIAALPADLAPGGLLHGRRFADILALTSAPPDHAERLFLASLALSADQRLTVLGDFTFWPAWSGRAPAGPEPPNFPAWHSLIVTEDLDPLKMFLALGGLFEAGAIQPAEAPALSRLELGQSAAETSTQTAFTYIVPPTGQVPVPSEGEESPPLPQTPARKKPYAGFSTATAGLGLRAVGEMGPVNPVSALMAVRAALNFARNLTGPGPAVYILTASRAQARLAALMLEDLEAPPGRIFCGEPDDFNYWPQAPLVIIDPAFEAPHVSHPWAWPSFGRQRLMRAWALARDKVWLTGRDEWLSRLSEAAPLAALWRLAGRRPAEADQKSPARTAATTFWEALDKAKEEVWAIVPTFEAFWWRPLEEHFLAAARRRARVTVLTAAPGPDSDREYAAAAIRTLAAYGCTVHLVSGFPGFMAAIDGRHLTWGHFIGGVKGAHIWGGLKSAVLPRAVPELTEIIQMPLINEKMGRKGGGLKNCRLCGWPMVLINQEQSRGYGDDQPLKISCLGHCQGPKNTRRIDEREPFAAPPKCGQDYHTFYQRVWRGRQQWWVCPHHPDGPRCPSYRVVPGDAS